MVEPLRVFVGIESKQWLASEVLRFSIASRTDADLQFYDLTHLPPDLKVPISAEGVLHRFAIPELCHYEGRAIYLDADTLVLSDLRELEQLDMGGHAALARPMHEPGSQGPRYTSVMLLDCAKLHHWKLADWIPQMQADRQTFRDTLTAGPKGLATQDFGDLPQVFNEQDIFSPSSKIIHFANLTTQPWKQPGHPHASLFLQELKAAMQAEEIPFEVVLREIQQGNIYPNLLQDLTKLV